VSEVLEIYVVYEDPKDFPGKLVLRRWVGLTPDPEPLIVATELKEIRETIPDHCVPINRFDDDDAKIKEVWI